MTRFDEGTVRVLARWVLALEGRGAGIVVVEAEDWLAILCGVGLTAKDGGITGGGGG